MSPRIWRRLSVLVVLILGIGALAAWRIHSNTPPEKTKRAPALAFTPDELTQPTMIATAGQLSYPVALMHLTT